MLLCVSIFRDHLTMTFYFVGISYLSHKENVTNKHIEMQIVNVLRLGNTQRASNLLLNLVSTYRSLKEQDFIYILDYCARTPDPLVMIKNRFSFWFYDYFLRFDIDFCFQCSDPDMHFITLSSTDRIFVQTEDSMKSMHFVSA